MEQDTIDLLKELVAIDSQNPSLVPGAAGESQVAAYVADWAKGAGLTAEIMAETPGRPSVVVRSGASSGGGASSGASSARSLLLCGHLDTVGVSEMSDPLSPVVRGDRLYGRGAYDMKGGLAAALIACREAARRGLDVTVAAVADEEHSSLGVQEVLRHVRADAAIVTEPTELTVATAHRGFVWTEISVAGVAAHGSRPHLGVDAIMKTGPVLTALDDLNGRLRGREHPRLGRGFVHASLIEGGREESTIPDFCTLTIERRTLPGHRSRWPTTSPSSRPWPAPPPRRRASRPSWPAPATGPTPPSSRLPGFPRCCSARTGTGPTPARSGSACRARWPAPGRSSRRPWISAQDEQGYRPARWWFAISW
jgi:acetylornithine deacetylase